MELLHEAQNPPYSRGLFYITIRIKFCEMRISNRFFYRELSEPIFTFMVRGDMVFCDSAMAKFSLKRIDEGWLKYSE